jgi:uncharacterized protein (TIGR02271 family)
MSWLSRLDVGMPVHARDGILGTIVSVPRVDLKDPTAPAEVIVLASPENAGPGVEEFRRVTREMIDRVEGARVLLLVTRAEVPRASAAVAEAQRRLRQSSQELRVPLAEERVTLETRVRELGYVQAHKKVEEYLDERDVPLRFHEVHVEHVPVDEIVPEFIAPYMDGETYVIPVIEEEVVVSTRLRLKEEIRVRRTTAQQTQTVRTPYRRERLVVSEHWHDTPDGTTDPRAQPRYVDGLADDQEQATRAQEVSR